MSSPLIVAVMAGGLGKRMKSDLPKVLHLLNGVPILVYVIRAAIGLKKSGEDLVKIIIIVGKYGPIIQQTLNQYLLKDELRLIEYVYQDEPKGTGHAVQQVLPILKSYSENSKVMVLSGDVPLITVGTLLGLLATYDSKPKTVDAAMITTVLENPVGNGRVLREGNSIRIIEEKDCQSDEERNIKEVNAGIYLFNAGSLLRHLPFIKNDNAQKEYYLPDVLPRMQQARSSTDPVVLCYLLETESQYELLNINDPEGLEVARKCLASLHRAF
jgi:bifunctional UDP-N-acetylglucosamine pyrophosphorylase / glucosamine-1-phosphate N-acetyltransferase